MTDEGTNRNARDASTHSFVSDTIIDRWYCEIYAHVHQLSFTWTDLAASNMKIAAAIQGLCTTLEIETRSTVSATRKAVCSLLGHTRHRHRMSAVLTDTTPGTNLEDASSWSWHVCL